MTSLLLRLRNGMWGDLIALLAGALLTFAYAPYSFFPISFISLMAVLLVWIKQSKWRTGFRGWLFGLGFFGTSVSWIYFTMIHYTGTPQFLAVIFTSLFVALLSLFPALNGYFYNRFLNQQHHSKPLLYFPTLWVIFEWLRAMFATGFPWLLLGDTQLSTPLIHYAPVFGVYGVSFFVAFTASALVCLFSLKEKTKIPLTLILIFIWAIGFGLKFYPWTTPSGKPIKVTLIQGNIPQQLKWTSASFNDTINRYRRLTKKHFDSQLIVWPEAAIPALEKDVKPLLKQLSQETKAHQSTLLLGIVVESEEKERYYNAVIALGKSKGRYYKRHLVPFGEYFPFPKNLKKLLDYYHIPMANFTEGKIFQKNISISGIEVAPLICYETIFPELVRFSVLNGANLLLAVSDDAWFDHTRAQAQHLQMTRLRAIENQRYLLFDTNDGITAIIAPNGDIIAKATPYQATTLTATITPLKGNTFWTTAGFGIVLFLFLLLLIIAALINKHEKNSRQLKRP
jgi:apolipoprotein N-acyltransferase